MGSSSRTNGRAPNLKKPGHGGPTVIAVVKFSEGSEIEDGPASFVSDVAQIRNILEEPRRKVADRDDLELLELRWLGN